jgi:hypothetical protein
VSAIRSHNSTGTIRHEASAEHFAIIDKLEGNDLAAAIETLSTHILKMTERYAITLPAVRRGAGPAVRRWSSSARCWIERRPGSQRCQGINRRCNHCSP